MTAPAPTTGATVGGPDHLVLDHVQLELGGMTCAACASRIEKKLNRLPGVTAAVNYATERAVVDFDPDAASPSQLIATVESIGYTAHLPTPAVDDEPEDHSRRVLARLVVAAVLGAPVLVLSMIPALQFRGWQWVALALATPVATWAAWPFHRSAVLNLRHGSATMDTLVSVGVTSAYLWSLWALLFTPAGHLGATMDMGAGTAMSSSTSAGSHHLYLEVASTTVALILLGRWFEARSKRRAGGALRALLRRSVADVDVLDGDDPAHAPTRTVPASALEVGQRFVVRPGERIATDGVIETGRAGVDTSLITGESLPIECGPGDAVTGGTISTDGHLVVRATRVGADTTLARMGRLVEQAQSGKAPVQRLADRVAGVFVPIVIVIAAIVLAVWWISSGQLDRAVRPAMAVLIIACPCALGLATPTALLVGTGRAAQLGVLITGPEVLERTRRVDTVVLDKTGTVTSGTMQVARVVAAPRPGLDSSGLDASGLDAAGLDASGLDVLALAASVERASEHPIARAIVAAAAARGATVHPVTDFRVTPGLGAAATVHLAGDGATSGPNTTGRARHVEVRRAAQPDAAGTQVATVVEVVADGVVVGWIALDDPVKSTSRAGLAALRSLGLRPVLLTGDDRRVADAVAAQVGIAPDDVLAQVTPADKLAVVARLQHEGRVVAMLGDGVNDAAALARADLGIAMGTGTDVAMEASDITLVRADLLAAADAIALGRRTLATIKGNLFWAFAYNVAAIPLAASGLLSPVIASAAMAGSSLFVVSNSLRLRRFRPVVATITTSAAADE